MSRLPALLLSLALILTACVMPGPPGDGAPPPGAPGAGPTAAPSSGGENAPRGAGPAVPAGERTAATARPAPSFADAVARVMPAVVYIRTDIAIGSGVLYRPDGFIMTNYHLIAESRRVTVTLGDGRALTGQVLGSQPDYDLAVLKVEAADLPFAFFGDANTLREGEDVVAIGYPLNLTVGGPSVANGIVSAKRPVPGGPTLVQTTVPLNRGNSGGPLINKQGQVVGINALRLNRLGDTPVEGISFAISGNDALDFAQGRESRVGSRQPGPASPAGAVRPPAAVTTVAPPPSQAASVRVTPPGPAGQSLPNQTPAGPASLPGVGGPAPGPPPTSTPIPLPPALVVIAGHDLVPPNRPGQPTTLIGAILNAGQTPVEQVRIVISFLDPDGRRLQSETATTDLTVIQPGEQVSFAVPLTRAPAQWSNLHLEVTASIAGPATLARSYRNLVTEGVEVTPASAGGDPPAIAGRIRNSGPAIARDVRLSAVFFDAAGKVIDIASGPPDLAAIPPGVTVSFRLPLRRPAGQVSFFLAAEGVR